MDRKKGREALVPARTGIGSDIILKTVYTRGATERD